MASDDTKPHGAHRLLPLRVWDLPTRLFHWLLVLLLAAAWYTGDRGDMERHALIGQAILTLIVFRLIWGIVGSQTVQFWNFVKGPKRVIAYAKQLLSRDAPRSLGHNPMGACMVVLMLLLLATQAMLGLFANDDIFFEGPLLTVVGKEWSDRLTGFHHLLFNVILAAVALHIAANLFYLIVKRENLIGPMITGRKWWPSPLPALRFTPLWAAALVLVVAAALIWALVTFL